MNANAKPNAENGDTDQRSLEGDVQRPIAALSEPTLAVDLVRAEIDQAIATAHKFPRVLDTVVKSISTMALYNEEAAQNCIYALPRGNKPIIGPSIGFANIVAGAWGNCRDGSRIVYIDRKEKMVMAEGVFLDLQTNRQALRPVNRRIVDKHGRIYNDDMIMVTGMAAASIAVRNAILHVVPRVIWFPIYEQALGIVRGTVGTFAERKDKAIKSFAQFGVKPEQLFMALGLKGEADLTFEHIPSLLGMYAQLRDGTLTVEEMFDPRRMTGRGFDTVENPLADAAEGDGGEPAADEHAEEHAEDPAAGTTATSGQAGGAQGGAQPGQGEAAAKAAGNGAPAAGGDQAGGTGPQEGLQRTSGEPQEGGTAKPKPAAAKPAKVEPAAKGELAGGASETPTGPQGSKQYVEHALAWLDTADERNWPSVNIEETWRGERKMRERCNVVEDDFDSVNKKYREVLKAAKDREAAGK